MKKISQEEFDRLVDTKIFKGQWDAYITWDCLDMYELADTKNEAKRRLFSRINYGDANILYRTKPEYKTRPRIAEPY